MRIGGFSQSFSRDINLLWDKAAKNLGPNRNIIIMDHGGYAMAYAPVDLLDNYNVVALEKTSFGFMNPLVESMPFL